MPPQITRVDFEPLNDTQKRNLNAAMRGIGDRHGVARAWWGASRFAFSGRQHIVTYWLNEPATVDQWAQAIANNSPYTKAQVLPFIAGVINATGTIANKFAQLQTYMNNHPAQWHFEDLPDWYTYTEPVEFVEPEEPPEGWPVSEPLVWIKIEE
jgi:hypothetical protein